MNGWVEKPLSEIADIIMGQSPDSKYYTEEEQGMPFIQGCAEFDSRYPRPKINCTQIKKVAKTGAILFSVRAPVGRINVADRDYAIGRGLSAISANDIDSDLLEKCLVFREPAFRAASQGSTFEAINSKELCDWPINFPEEPREQRAIAEVLSTLDRAIEQTEALIAKQQRIKTGLMQDLLTKGIDAHGNIRSESTHAFKDSPLGRIPVEWTPSSLGKVYSELPRNGIYKPAAQIGAGVILVGQTSFTEERLIDYTQTRRVQVSDSETRAYGLRAGDILVSRVFATVAVVVKLVVA